MQIILIERGDTMALFFGREEVKMCLTLVAVAVVYTAISLFTYYQVDSNIAISFVSFIASESTSTGSFLTEFIL